MTLTPVLSGFPVNFGTASRYSWIPIKLDLPDRPLFAQASYITNFSDLTISLSAPSVNIGGVEIIDKSSGLSCNVSNAFYQANAFNGLHVITQNLNPTYNTVSLADKLQNNVSVFAETSSLQVHVTNLDSLTAQGESIISLLQQTLTSNQVYSETINVSVLNPISAIELTNQLSAVTVLNPATAIDVLNVLDISGCITIANPVTAIALLNQLTSISISNDVLVHALQTLPMSGLVTVANPITGVNIINSVALKDIYSNNVSVVAATSSLNVNVTNPVIATISASNVPIVFAPSPNFDAFNRLRISSPLTLFDSSHRYRDNNLWSSMTTIGGTYSFNQNQGLIEMTVNGLSGSSVIRETTKVFAYQPGKSLQVMNTFVMAPSATNLRQRVGYFGEDNGIYVQLDGETLSFVERSLVNGSPSLETIVPSSSWNGDKLDGTGPSGLTIDITKAQIFWMDIEWLGVGTVRCGFVINGQFIVCHSFHHANLIASTYITTGSLPLRYEITNKGNTYFSSTLKQVCSTVISEGGYELRGFQQAVSIPITAPILFETINTYYPIISLRLKTSPNRLDAIIILTALSILGKGNGINYNWQLRTAGTTTGGAWVDTGSDSSVEYNITGTSYSGGRILASGFLNSSNQGSPNLNVLKEALFKFQLERNSFTKTPYEITLVVATDTSNGSGIFASLDWEEISR